MADRDLIGRTLGKYILRELITEGGYGAVYRAEEPQLERYVVVKVLHEERSDSDSRERFLREAKLASQIDHPCATPIHDFGVEDEGRLLWIAMEWVRGVPLDAWLDKHGPMPPEPFGPFFQGVCEVVHAAHKQGIIHRDLKPSNIMVVDCEGRLHPKLIDFGIAKWHRLPKVALDPGADEDRAPDRGEAKTERLPVRPRRAGRIVACHDSESRRQLTPPRGCIGSPPYMALEQWSDGDAVGPEADIYALTIIAYETLTGRDLFVADRAADYFELHRRASVPPLGDGFPPAVDLVIRGALDKDPQLRPATPLELASDLQRALRKIKREQIRVSAQQWFEQGAPRGLLWGADVLEKTLPSVPLETLRPMERSFIAESQRWVRRLRRVRRSLVALAVVVAVGGLLFYAAMQTRVTEATITQSELEQGRSKLLHGEPEAQIYLGRAYQRDHSWSTAFMRARAVQPLLAERARFASSFERMWSVVFSPSGKQLATTDDQNAQVWDAQSSRLLFTLDHGDTVYHAVYSADGTKLVTGCGDGAVRIWDPATGVLVRELRRDKVTRYYVVALSPDERLVAGLDLGVAHVWDVDTGTLIAELRVATPSSFPSLGFSADGRWLAMGTGNDVRVFDTQTWTVAHNISGLSIHSLSWDPTGPRLVTGSAEGDVSIWAIPTGERVHHLRELGESVDAVASSPDGRLVVAGSRDGVVQVWDATSAKLRSQSNYLRSKVLSVEFDRTSSLIAAASSSGSVAVSNAASGMQVTVLDGLTTAVRVAHFDPSSQRVVGASWDGTARIWDATSPYRRWSSPSISDDCGLVTSLEPDRRFLAIRCNDGPTRVWDTAHDQLVAELPSATLVEGDFTSAYPAVSVAGDRAAIARGNNVEIYELPSGRLLCTIRHGAPVSSVAFAATGYDVVSGDTDGTVIVTRGNGALIALPASSAGIDAAGFLADGRVVVADAERRLRVYDLGGTILAELQTRARVRTLRMSPDSRRLVTVPNFKGKVVAPELWDVEHYQPITQLGSKGQGQVYSARFVAGGQVITACGDAAVRLWDSEAGLLLRLYRGGSSFLVDATLSADGTMLIGGGGDGQLRFWEAVSGRPLWTMPAHRSHLIGVHVEGADIITRGFSGDIARWSLPRPEQVMEACDHDERCAIVAHEESHPQAGGP